MRKTLLATTALAAAGAFAAGPALSADMLSIGVGGYMQQWIGMSSLDNGTDDSGGVTQYSDSEIFFKGKLEADNGLAFSVKVEFEGNTHPDVVDESQLTVSGSFGQITLGSEDDVATLMHYGNGDVGVGLNCGDASFIAGVTTCARSGGKGLGTAGHLIGGDANKISYVTPRMGGAQFGVSYIPHANKEDAAVPAPTNNDTDAWAVGLNVQQEIGDASVALSVGHYQASQMGAAEVSTVYHGEDHVESSAYSGNKIDDQTFSNFGLQVGFGAVGFDVAYAVHDGGMYDGDDKVTKMDYEVASAGVNYSDGPMAISLSHMMVDADDNSEIAATMLSLSYTLAPGIASKSSIVSAEQDAVDGTAFITGFTLSF